jgi:tetratricopeptide (TPR) repeat protein
LKEAKLGFGEKDAHVAAALNNLAELARTQRMWEKAEGLYKECLDLLRELKETTPNSSSSSSSSDSSSKVDKRKGAEYKAEATIAAALHNLASCMLQNNKPKEAYENYRTSLNLKQVVFENENHPEIALTLHHMAEALLLLERIEDAIVVLERSVKITDAVGIGHTPTAFRRMRRLCQLYEIKKRFDDVDAMKKRIETQFSKQV